jgi:hypothetical protein
MISMDETLLILNEKFNRGEKKRKEKKRKEKKRKEKKRKEKKRKEKKRKEKRTEKNVIYSMIDIQYINRIH